MENNFKMKKLFKFIIFFFISNAIIGQDVHYTLTNPRNVTESGDTYHMVDVLTFSSAGFKLGSGQLYVNFDTTAFGLNVVANDHLEIIIPEGSVLNESVGAPPFVFNFYGDIVLNDNTFNRFSYSWQHDFSNACLFEENINYYTDVLFTIKLKFKPGQAGTDPGICFEGSAVYIDQTFTACGPFDCSTSNCFDFPGQQLVADFYTCESACTIVYSTEDDGPGSLRNAIACADIGDTIVFAPNLSFDSIQLTTTQLELNKHVNIIAKEDLSILVNGSGIFRVFNILVNREVYIEGLQLTSGEAGSAKSIRNRGMLTLNNVTIHNTGNEQSNNIIRNENQLIIQGVTRILTE